VNEPRGTVSVILPRSLVALFPGLPRRLEVAPGTVGDVIGELGRQTPGLRERLCETGPRIRPHINVFVNGRPATIETPAPAGATVHVIPAVSGGATEA
jgi:sulfur-carrier protein